MSKYLREFGRKKWCKFTKEELEDIYLEFKYIVEIYELKSINNLDSDTLLIEEGKSFYHINCDRNAYIDIVYFEVDFDLLIEDLKNFVKIIKNVLGFEIINGWQKDGFSVEYEKNVNGEPYIEISLGFYKLPEYPS